MPPRPRPAGVHHDRRGRARHDGRRHRRGVRPQRLLGGRRRGRPRRPSSAVGSTSSTPPGARSSAASSREEDQAELVGRVDVHHRPARPRRRRLRGRGGRGVASRSRSRSSASSRRIVKPETILATNTSSLSVTEISTANLAPGPRHRRPLLQPRAGAELRRDHPHGRHRAGGARGRQGAGGPARQEPRDLRRPGRVHRQHAAVRLPQPRGLDVRGSTSPPARTSTPRCGSAAATRWARWRCST